MFMPTNEASRSHKLATCPMILIAVLNSFRRSVFCVGCRCLRSAWLLAAACIWAPLANAEDLPTANDAFERGEYVTALELYETLAAQGEAEAQFQLGLMYEQGLGTDVDGQMAQRYYEQAAEQQSPQALDALGTLHLKGEGVIQNFKESLRLFQQAAEQGYPRAQHNLGIAYADGKGTFRDPVKAHMWFNLAAANGFAEAAASRERLAASMAQSEITRAQDKAMKCADQDFVGC
jgi:TPR repeat protein